MLLICCDDKIVCAGVCFFVVSLTLDVGTLPSFFFHDCNIFTMWFLPSLHTTLKVCKSNLGACYYSMRRQLCWTLPCFFFHDCVPALLCGVVYDFWNVAVCYRIK